MQPEIPNDDQEYRDFCRAIVSIHEKILHSLEQQQPLKIRDVGKTWPEMREELLPHIDDIMLCSSPEAVVKRLEGNHTIGMILVELMTELHDPFLADVLFHAFLNRPAKGSNLPGQAFATFLIELCNRPHLVVRPE